MLCLHFAVVFAIRIVDVRTSDALMGLWYENEAVDLNLFADMVMSWMGIGCNMIQVSLEAQ